MAIAMIACNNEELPVGQTPAALGDKVTVEAYAPGGDKASSRIVFQENEGDEPTVSLSWSTEESFSVIRGSEMQTFSKNTEGNTFTGTLPVNGSGDYYAFYPATASAELSIDLSTQTGALDNKLTYMYATSTDGCSYKFQHCTALLKVAFIGLPNDAIIKQIKVNTIGPKVDGKFNPSNPSDFGGTNKTITINHPATEDIYIYLPPIPVAQKTLHFDVTTCDDKVYKGTMTSTSNKPIEAGKLYTGSVKMSEVVIEGNENTITFIANGVSFNMIKVEGGTFNMGGYVSTTISKTYYIGETEVTQKLWNAIMDYNPSTDLNDNLPVNYITWNDTQKFLSKLNKLLSAEFRLPTEAEWEFACKGGNKSKGYKYSGSDNVDDVAWYEWNSSSILHDVGSKQPNELGLYDMCGNVLEWCYDGYERTLIGGTDPIGVNEFVKVNRGGNAWDYARDNNWRNHSPYGLDAGYKEDGFRLAITIK